MTAPHWQVGTLVAGPVLERLDLVAGAVADALRDWDHADRVGVAEIDPGLADTAALTDAFELPASASGNCVVVGGRRAGEERVAACVVRSDTRADVNYLVKRTLDVRKATFLDMERAVAETGMEYGGITPVGLPEGWRLLVDASLVEASMVIVGSGVRRSKLLLPGDLLPALPRAEVVEGLGRPTG